MTYFDRLVTEATLEAADDFYKGSVGDALRGEGHLTLATIARKPEVIAAVNRVRDVKPKDYWRGVNRPAPLSDEDRKLAAKVCDFMPGYCCLMDAVAILARL